jgi:hypothetical protein
MAVSDLLGENQRCLPWATDLPCYEDTLHMGRNWGLLPTATTVWAILEVIFPARLSLEITAALDNI